MAYATLHFERDGFVGWLRLSRPDRLNAFTPEMWRELRELGAELRDDPELRALVVIGEGRAFSSGIDTSVFAGDTLDGDTLETDRDAPRRHDDPAADEAFRIGLTQRLVPDAELESTAGELAATIAAQPPLAVEGAKRAVNVAGTVPTREGLRIEAEGQAVCLRSDDMKEALAAFVEQ